MAGHDQRITLSGPVQKRLSRRGRAIRNLAEGGVVLVGDNLQRRVHDVTREYALGAIRMQVEGQHACCVTGQRLDIETARNACLILFDQIDLAGVDDWRDHGLWRDFTVAYEDAISRCSTEVAPWTIVPSNAKWYRNLVVAETLAA